MLERLLHVAPDPGEGDERHRDRPADALRTTRRQARERATIPAATRASSAPRYRPTVYGCPVRMLSEMIPISSGRRDCSRWLTISCERAVTYGMRATKRRPKSEL